MVVRIFFAVGHGISHELKGVLPQKLLTNDISCGDSVNPTYLLLQRQGRDAIGVHSFTSSRWLSSAGMRVVAPLSSGSVVSQQLSQWAALQVARRAILAGTWFQKAEVIGLSNVRLFPAWLCHHPPLLKRGKGGGLASESRCGILPHNLRMRGMCQSSLNSPNPSSQAASHGAHELNTQHATHQPTHKQNPSTQRS